jgi:hypothetical protein
MKGELLLTLMLAVTCSSASIVGIGQTCDSSSTFVTTNFFVNPYPPTSGQVMSIEMDGVFSRTQFVSDIAVRTSYNGGKYTYKYFDYNQNCLAGQGYTFKFPLTSGTGSGLYTIQVLLEQKQGSAVSCWQFTYHI